MNPDYTAHANADNAAACARIVKELCAKYEIPFVDVGPTVDRWLADTPDAKFVPHVHADWYHPNQWGAALVARALHEGICRHWPELPIAPVNVPPLDKN